MTARVDWLGLTLAGILCIAVLYILCYRPTDVKEGFLTSAGSGVMQPPTRIKCSKVSLNATAGPSLVQSGGQTWLCEDHTNATKLIAGDTVLKMAYLSRNDIVCISQDASGTIYSCMDQSLSDEDESADYAFDNYTTSCNAYYSKYTDISNALTTLIGMKNTILANTDALKNSKSILDTMRSEYKCVDTTATKSTKTSKEIICNAVIQTQGAIASNVTKSSDLEKILIRSIQPALDSRTGLIRTLREYHCDFSMPVI